MRAHRMHTGLQYARIAAFCALVLAMALALGACASDGPDLEIGEEVTMPGRTFSFDQKDYPAPQNLFPAYEIVPGDVLDVLFQIQTWKEKENFILAVDHQVSVKFVHAPELNEIQNIQPNGMISLPYIGEIHVSGLTVTELTERLKQAYASILRDPEIWVTVPEYRSHIKELKKDLHTASRGLSRLVTVRPDGICTFPLAGDLFVAGRTLPQVKEALDNIYTQYLPGLHVDLFLQEHSGSVVYVLGQVNRGGAFNISKPISVIEALAMAGGYNNDAELTKVMVYRKQERRLVATRLNLKNALNVTGDSEFFYLRPDDIVYVPRTGLSELAEMIREIESVFLFRGWTLDGPLFDDALIEIDPSK